MEHKEVLLIGFGAMEEKMTELLQSPEVDVMTFGSSRLNETVGQLVLSREKDEREEAMDRGLVLFHNFTQE